MKKSFNEILSELQDAPLKKVQRKVPSWSNTPELIIPSKLCSEQCSSERTAIYKASLALKAVQSGNKHFSSDTAVPDSIEARIAELTGGLGVDCWAFSKSFSRVLYNERDSSLKEAADHNFALLGCGNIETHNRNFRANDTAFLEEFHPDIIYLDPARRSSSGKKVFKLKDCEPDVTQLIPVLKKISELLMLKLSPMADISVICNELGSQLSEIHCISLGGEMKEILCLVNFRNENGTSEPLIVATDTENILEFRKSEENAAKAFYADGIVPGEYLFEPDPAILKASAFKLICKRFGLRKLAPSTHLYLSEKEVPFGKCHRIDEILPFDKRSISLLKSRLTKAEITARNLPISSDELRKKMDIPQGGNVHIFAFSALLSGSEDRWMIISEDV